MSLPGRLRASEEDRAVLAVPPLAEAGPLVRENLRRLDQKDILLLGRPLAELRRQARHEILLLARNYLPDAGQLLPLETGAPLFLAGHQPELFHPGVWVKNFALCGLARRLQGVSLNLIVDNDIARSTTLRLPAWKESHRSGLQAAGNSWPRLVQVPFDFWKGDVPYEIRQVHEENLFASFPERLEQWTKPWGFNPFVFSFWEEVRQEAGRTPFLGERFGAARRTFEQRWGCRNLELPISSLSRSGSFAWFACHLLRNLERFQNIFNKVVGDYRRRHGIRSRNHPMPDLARDGEWLEAPFWGWQNGHRRRSRLFVQLSSAGFHLRAGNQPWPALKPASPDPANLIDQWLQLQREGFQVRPRALTTTLFARLFLGDLFVHGIGGGIYDEITDEVIRHFHGLEPPGYLVLSATLLLPLSGFSASAQDCRHFQRTLRDRTYNPQRYLAHALEVDERVHHLLEEKENWVVRPCTSREERRQRFHVLRQLNRQLQGYLDGAEELRQRERLCRQQVQANQLLHRRDFSFCLHPEARLREFFQQFL